MTTKSAIIGAAALFGLLGACQTTHREVGDGLFACRTGRTLMVREDGAKRIVRFDDGPEIVMSPMPNRRHYWWITGNDYSLQIRNDVASWLARDGQAFRRDWCPRVTGSA